MEIETLFLIFNLVDKNLFQGSNNKTIPTIPKEITAIDADVKPIIINITKNSKGNKSS